MEGGISRWRRAGRGALIVAVAFAIIVAAGYGLLAWRLASGPILLSYFDNRIIQAVQAAMPEGVRLEATGTALERDESTGRIQLSLLHLEVLGEQGGAVLRAPRAALEIFGPALLAGRIVPAALWLVQPSISLIATEGGWRVRGSDGLLVGSPAEVVSAALALLMGGPGPAAAGIRDGTILIEGESGETQRLEAITLTAARSADGVVLDARIGTGAGAPRVSATLRGEEDGDHLIKLEAHQLAASDFGPLAPEWLAASFTSPISTDLALRLDKAGTLEALSGHLRVGAGHVGGGQLDLLIDEADLSFAWSRGSGRFEIKRSTLLAGYDRLTVSGEILVPERGEFNYGTLPIRLAFSDVTFGDPAGGRAAVYPSINLDALYIPQQGLVHVSRLDVAAEEAAMSFVGIIGGRGQASPGIQLAGTMLPVPFGALPDLWPPFLGYNARQWIIEHLDAGQITDAVFSVDIAPGTLAAALRGVPLPESAYLIEFGLADVEFRYLGDMPPISGASGSARLTPGSFDLRMAPGSVVQLDGEAITVGGGRFQVEDLHARAPIGNVSFRLAGSVPSMLRLFDYHPLEIPSRRGLDPKKMSGDAQLDIDLAIPLIKVVRLDDVELGVDGRVENFTAHDFHGASTVSEGNIRLSVSDGHVRILGEGLLDGVPAEIAINEALDGSTDRSGQSVTMLLDDTARERLGIGLADIVTGPMTASISDLQAAASETTQRIEADLTQARLVFPHLGIDKPPGEPATATFQLTQDAETVRLSELTLESAELRIAGEAAFSRSGELLRLDLPVVRTARGTDVSVSGRREGGENIFTLRGQSIDLRPSLRSVTKLDPTPANSINGGSMGRTRIEIEVESVLGFNGQRLSGVAAAVAQNGGEVSRFDLTGRTAGGNPVRLRYVDGGAGAELTAQTDDAGRLLAWTGLYSNMRGGRLQLAAGRRGTSEPLGGRLIITGFAVADDPSLSRLIATGEQETRQQVEAAGRSNGAQRVNPANVGFDTLSVPFTRSASHIVIREGVLRGPAVGATLEGSIDFNSSQMSLNGTYVPLYELNNLFGQLPLFGPLLGGRRNEGLLGITYSVSGSLDSPVLTVNPLSFVAPGVFRYILGMDNPRAPRVRSGLQPQRDPAMR